MRGIVNLAGLDACGVNETASRIDADVGLQPEIPLVTLLRLAHLGIALANSVLGRRRGDDERRVHDGSATQQSTLLFKVCAGGLALVGKVYFARLIITCASAVVDRVDFAIKWQRALFGRHGAGPAVEQKAAAA